MSIAVTCPGCAKKLAVPDTMAGKSGRCPCGASIAVPAALAVATAILPPVPSGPPRKTVEERREILSRYLYASAGNGWRVESQGDLNAVMAHGQPVNHVLHLILTLCTCSLWGIVWLWAASSGGEERVTVMVDESGRIR